MRFEVDRAASGQDYCMSTSALPVAVIPPLLQTYLKYMLLFPEGKMGEALESSKDQCSFGNRETLDRRIF